MNICVHIHFSFFCEALEEGVAAQEAETPALKDQRQAPSQYSLCVRLAYRNAKGAHTEDKVMSINKTCDHAYEPSMHCQTSWAQCTTHSIEIAVL